MSSTASTLGADLGDLPTSELLANGHAALEWIARYLDHPERVSVLSQVVPGEIREMLPVSPPEQPEPLGDILRDFGRQPPFAVKRPTGRQTLMIAARPPSASAGRRWSCT